jgi:hypothetical protein
MSEKVVVVGAGPVGTETALLLQQQGHEVVVVTRSGGGPQLKGVRRVAADASDADVLTAQVQGASALVNCANPADYTKWEQVWPPLAASLLSAAERTGATWVSASSLYAYGPVDGPMVEGMPDRATDHKGRLRAGMWAEALRLHRAGRIHAVEVRASDYLGPRVGANGHIPRHVPAAVRGKAARVIGRPDLPHTWTDVGDVARAGRCGPAARQLGSRLARTEQPAADPARGADGRAGLDRQAPGARPRDPGLAPLGSGPGEPGRPGARRDELHLPAPLRHGVDPQPGRAGPCAHAVAGRLSPHRGGQQRHAGLSYSGSSAIGP